MERIAEKPSTGACVRRLGGLDAYELHLLARRQRAIAIGDAAVRLGRAVRRALVALTAGATRALRDVLPSWRAVP